MTNSSPTCDCGRPIADNAYLCQRCTSYLERELGDVHALADEIETTRLRQSRTGGAGIGGSRSTEKPLPFNENASLREGELRVSLVAWVRITVDERGLIWPTDTLRGMAEHLLGQIEWLRHRPEATEAKRDLEHHIGRLRSIIDRAPERVYAGPCGAVDYDEAGEPQEGSPACQGSVYGHKNARVAICDTCGAQHDPASRRAWLLEAVEDQLAHAALLSKALSNLGRPIPDATIRSWAERGRLVSHGTDDRGRAVYRVGDVLDLLSTEAARQGRAKKAS